MANNKFNKKSNNFKRKNYKSKEAASKDDMLPAKHNYNDVSWYTKNDQMLRDAASYSYNSPLGAKTGNPTNTEYSSQTQAVPGVCSFALVPTIGISTDAFSPANIAANNIYAYVRHMNSGSKNYDQADLMLYLMAMDSLFSCWNWMKRIYGYITLYSQYNWYYPGALAEADWVDVNDIRQNLADFRLYLNETAAQISSFCVPSVMPYFVRHSWLYSNLYLDSSNHKAQTYMFSPAGFYTYNETGSTYGGQLVFTPIRTGQNKLFTFEALRTLLNNMLQAVSYSEDIGVMSGDILKAYGQEKLFKITAVSEDYSVTPVYNEEVLNQMHNSNVVPWNFSNATASEMNITQNPDTGFLVAPTQLTANSTAADPKNIWRTEWMINMPWDDVTPANTMVGTRLTTPWHYNSETAGTKPKITIDAMGSEFVISRTLVGMNYVPGSPAEFYRTSYSDDVFVWNANSTVQLTLQRNITLTGFLSQFDWHPLIPLVFVGGAAESENAYFIGYLGDITNYTLLKERELSNMHLTALMSEFNIPQLGSF